MSAVGSKCRVCREPAIIDLPRHNANFCGEHLLQLCRRQVEKAIHDHDMLSVDDRVLSGRSHGNGPTEVIGDAHPHQPASSARWSTVRRMSSIGTAW